MTMKLVHGNYAVWIVMTRATLMRKLLVKYIEAETRFDAWDLDKDMKALGIIIEALDVTQLQYVKGSRTAASA